MPRKLENYFNVAVRLPAELKSFVETEAKRNSSSQNSEIIRAVRLRAEALGALAKPKDRNAAASE